VGRLEPVAPAHYLSRHYAVSQIDRAKYQVVRTAEAFDRVDGVGPEFSALIASLSSKQPQGLLCDLRLARGRNDRAFEVQVAEYRRRLLSLTRNTVVLVATATGALQVMRHAVLDGLPDLRVVADPLVARRLVLAGLRT